MSGTKLVVFLSACAFACAQTNANKASIGGLISSAGNSPVPNAKVRVINEATGLERAVETNDLGEYQFEALDPGTYEVSVDSSGASASVKKLTLNIGGNLRVNIELALAKNVEKVDLSSSAMWVSESASSHVVTLDLIQSLPINGRRFQDFATLAPAVQALTETRAQLSFSGQRGIYSNVVVDGTDYNEPFTGGIRGGDRSDDAFTIPQSAMQEFQVIGSAPPVEYGRTTGGILNAITRSGSNSLHGEGFYRIRDQSLGMGDPFGQQSLERQQQFGGGTGGPIKKDKLFFFLAGERQMASFPRAVRFSALDSVSTQVTPDIAPAYNYLRSLEGPFNQTNDATAIFGRADWQLRSGSRLAIHYNNSGNQALNALSLGSSLQPQTNQAYSANGAQRDRTNTAGGQWTNIVSASTINDLRVQYSRETSSNNPNSIGPSVAAGVIGNFGTSSNLPTSLSDYRLQVADGISMTRGRHSTAFGVDYNYIGVSQSAGADQFGAFTIDNSDVRQTLQILSGTSGNRFDDPSVLYSRQVGGLKFNGNEHQVGVYAQDTWRIVPTFTLTYGLRWEAQVTPQPISDNPFLVSNVRDFAYPRGRLDPTVIGNQFSQWAPRVGFAWDLMGRQKTVIRGAAGVFYGQTPISLLAGPITDVSMAPSDLLMDIGPAAGSSVYRQFLAGGIDLNHYPLSALPVVSVPYLLGKVAGAPNIYAQADVLTTTGRNFRNPRSTQVGFSVQRRLSNGLVVVYEFNHINAVHLERNVAWNTPLPFVQPGDLSLRPFFGLRSGTMMPNPNLGAITVRDSSARSNYTGHNFRVEYRISRFHVGANYTLSFNKSDDDTDGNSTALIAYPNPYDFSREYNWSSIDTRHQGNGFATWLAPKGFEVSGLFHVRSGLPIDASTGADSAGLLIGNLGNRPLDRPGLYMLRNSFRNFSFKTIDLRVARNFAVKEGMRVQVYGEMFNLFNFNNVAFISAAEYPNNPAFIYGPGILPNGNMAPIDPGFLRVRTASGAYDPGTMTQQGTPFQAQLGLTFIF